MKKSKSLKKVIILTAVKTVIALIAAALIVFGILSFGFPRTIAGMCEKTQNYNLAIKYYSLSYFYTGDSQDLLSCVHNSISSENDEDIILYTEKFIAHEDFEKYCEESGEKQTVYANLLRAKYRTGDKQGALETARVAMDGVTDFPTSSAMVTLILEVRKAQDAETAKILLDEIEKYTPTSAQSRYYDTLQNVLRYMVSSSK